MRRVYQTEFTNEEKSVIGNCLQACLASLFALSLEDVPRFTKMKHYEDFLGDMGVLLHRYRSNPLAWGIPQIVSFEIPNFSVNHCVIWQDGEIIHDPRREPVKLGDIAAYYVFVDVLTNGFVPIDREFHD